MSIRLPNPAARKYFGDVALRYDEKRERRKHHHIDNSRITEAFLDKCEPGSTVADVPAGTGRALRSIIDRKLHYIGIDVSADMIALCKQKIADDPRAHALVADARSTALADGAADYLISIKFIKWLPTEQMVLDALSEFRRVCRKRALVNVNVAIDKQSPSRSLSSRILRAFRRRSRSTKLPSSTISPSAFEALSDQAGWRVVDVIQNPAFRGNRFYILEGA